MARPKTCEPHDGQRLIIAEAEKRFRVACCGRRWGKTFLALNILHNRAVKEAWGLFWWVAPTYAIARQPYRDFYSLFKPDIRHSNDTMMEYQLRNGAYIAFKSAENWKNLVGIGLDFLVVDECGRVDNLAWQESLRPTLSDKSAPALFIGTPKGRKNWFHELYQRGVNGEDGYASFRFPTYTNPFIPPNEIEEAKRQLPETIFKQEYLAEFIDSSSTVFHNVNDCILGTSLLDGAKPARRYVAGVDLAKHQDYTVVCILDVHTRGLVYMERFQHVEWSIQIKHLASILDRFAKPVCVIDDTKEETVSDLLKHQGYNVKTYTFTSNSKAELIQKLMLAMESKRINYPSTPETEILMNELRNYEYEITARNISYNAPSGQHDDCVIALALANHGLVSGAVLGDRFYSIDKDRRGDGIY